MFKFIIPLLAHTLINLVAHSQSENIAVKLTNEIIITSDQFLMAPQWSPDDNKLLLSAEGNNGIYVLTIENEELYQVSNLYGSGYRPSWSDQGDFIYFRYKDQFATIGQYETRTVFLDGKKRQLEQEIDPFTLFTGTGTKKSNDISIKYNRTTLQIEGTRNNTNDRWLITSGKDQHYHPILSPNRKLVLVHANSKMFVYSSDGSGLVAELGRGFGSSWSPDSNQILFSIEESNDGHYINNSELFHTDLNGNRTQLTFTSKRIEQWPNWSNDGKKIAYSDLKTGELIISTIEFKNK